jgi:hypothetical protein
MLVNLDATESSEGRHKSIDDRLVVLQDGDSVSNDLDRRQALIRRLGPHDVLALEVRLGWG